MKKLRNFSMMLVIIAAVLGSSLTCFSATFKMSKAGKTAYTGTSFTLTVKNAPSSKKIKWSSSDSSVAKLTKVSKTKYTVKCKKAGTATITAKAGDKSCSCTVTVEKGYDVKNYVGKSYTKFLKDCSLIRPSTVGEEPVYYTGTLYVSTEYGPNGFFFRKSSSKGTVTGGQNASLKNVAAWGVYLGDSLSTAKKTLKKAGFKLTKHSNNGTNNWYYYSKGSHSVSLLIKNGKVSTFQFG